MKNWLLVFLWAGLIFFLSHQPDLSSGLPKIWDFFLAKSAHILEYAILTFLLIRVFREYQLSQRKVLILAIILAIGYALADEYHQSFILGRESSFRDVGIDSLGILLTAWLNRKKMIK